MADLFARRYRIERELGRGSFGVVYLAYDTRLSDRSVAIKILHPALNADPAVIRRFHQEAGILASLDHDHIVPVYDVGAAEDRRFIVMRYIPGPTLARILDEEGPQSPERVFAWLRQIAAGLDYAHGQGVLHRDLKPSNLLWDEARDRVLISDFGLAKAVQASGGSSVSQSQAEMTGTAYYMPPEVIRGRKHTPASDLYSLGCVLYELLAGRPPYQGENVIAITSQHVLEPTPRLELEGDLGQAMAEAVAALMAKDPDERPASAGEVVAGIEHTLAAQEKTRRQAEEAARLAALEKERQAREAAERERREKEVAEQRAREAAEAEHRREQETAERARREREAAEKERRLQKTKTQRGDGGRRLLAGAAVLALALLAGGWFSFGRGTGDVPTATAVAQIPASATLIPSPTFTHAPKPTATATSTLTPTTTPMATATPTVTPSPTLDTSAWQETFDKAVAAYNQAQWQQVVSLSTEAIALMPDEAPDKAQAYNYRGWAYHRLNDDKKAILDFTRAIELAPEFARAYNNRGVMYNELGQYQKAIPDLTQAIALKHQPLIWPYANRGYSYYRLGQYPEALADFNQCLELDNTYASCYLQRGLVFQAMGDLQAAKADYDRCVEYGKGTWAGDKCSQKLVAMEK